jgi:Ca2+-binding RTX toxin-like protein
MVNIVINGNLGVDIRGVDLSVIYYANEYYSGTTLFQAIFDDSNWAEFRGTGFQYNWSGEPIAGTVKSYSVFIDGVRAAYIDGVSIAATAFADAALSYGTKDDVALMASAFKGNDTFKGGNLSDYYRLYGGNDTLLGNGGDDFLFGGAGNDKITGGLGRDRLYGESGSDTFIFKSAKESTVSSTGRDTIYDFTNDDTIHLSAIDANTKVAGNQAFSFISTKAFTGKAGELRYDKKSSDTYIYADVNGDKKADFAIHLDDALTLSRDDFIL